MLSGDNTRSCASCHSPEKAFTDGLKTNTSLSGSNLRRNTPTLTYASLQHGQFWDLRQPDLEKQSVDVVSNADTVIEIPQYGVKHSLNISVSAGIVVWDLVCKLRKLS